jgi:hypothetical protein
MRGPDRTLKSQSGGDLCMRGPDRTLKSQSGGNLRVRGHVDVCVCVCVWCVFVQRGIGRI